MRRESIHPPGAGASPGCLSQLDAERIALGVYPLDSLKQRLDHVDFCAHERRRARLARV